MRCTNKVTIEKAEKQSDVLIVSCDVCVYLPIDLKRENK